MPKYLVEQNKSSTFAIAFEKQGWLPEWPNGADCKSAGYAFGGSNPSPPTFPKTTQKIKNPIPLIRFRILRFYIPTYPHFYFWLGKEKFLPAQAKIDFQRRELFRPASVF